MNNTNIKFIDGGLSIKQGDHSSAFEIQLLDENNHPINNLGLDKATLRSFNISNPENYTDINITVTGGDESVNQ